MEMFDLFYCLSFAAMLWSVLLFVVRLVDAIINQKGSLIGNVSLVVSATTLFVLMNRI